MKLINCNESEYVLHQVQKDENLDTILQKYKVGLSNITRNNPNIELYEGEMIEIRRKNKLHHIVKPMENLTIIAEKYNTDIDTLIKQNNLTSKRLFIGQSLMVENSKHQG